MVVACVTVHDRAGIIASPTKDLGIPGAVLKDRGDRRSFMAAGYPDSELVLCGSS